MCIRYWPEDKTRNEVVGARVNLYMAAKKWDMAAAVASHLVKVEPENEAWWVNLAYAVQTERGHRAGRSHFTEASWTANRRLLQWVVPS